MLRHLVSMKIAIRKIGGPYPWGVRKCDRSEGQQQGQQRMAKPLLHHLPLARKNLGDAISSASHVEDASPQRVSHV